MRPLSRDELPSETIALARYLLGKLVVRVLPEGVLAGRVVETEAYPPGDAAMHAYQGITPRNRSLFLRYGHAYVYLITHEPQPISAADMASAACAPRPM